MRGQRSELPLRNGEKQASFDAHQPYDEESQAGLGLLGSRSQTLHSVGRGDNSYNDAAYKGLIDLARAYHGWIQDDPDDVNFGSELQLRYVETRGGFGREVTLRTLAERGYALIYAIGFLYSDSVAKVARDFPTVHFVIIDAYVPNLTDRSNITCLAFKENEGAFLVGAVAALVADGSPIGFLGGMDIALIHRFENGFPGGAMYLDPSYRGNHNVLSRYTGTTPVAFNDPARGYQISIELFRSGASVIFHAAGGTGAGLFKAALESNRAAIGVDSDEGLLYRMSKDPVNNERGKHILTSMIKRVDVALAVSGKKFLDSGGRIDGGYWSMGLKENAVDYAENRYNVEKLATLRGRLEQVKADVVGGKVTVPDEGTDMRAWASSLE